MQDFIYLGLPSRVVFARGALSKVAEEVKLLGCRRVLVLSTPAQESQAAHVQTQLGELGVGLFAEATMHTPIDVSLRAVAMAGELRADCLLALGGGSTIGLGKAIALRTDLPQIVIPTTYAGSEMTPILGQTEAGRKSTLRTLAVLPEVVLYDVDLTLSLPPALSATSGLNAMAHAVEGLWARDGNPILSLMAEEGIRALAGALPQVVAHPDDVQVRSEAQYGAWLCAMVLGSAGMALHHKLCHTLGGAFDLPHAETHAVILPYATAYNAVAAPAAVVRLCRALGVSGDAAGGLFDLARQLHAPASLRVLGLPEDALMHAADLAVESMYWNPRPVERDAVLELLTQAWHGNRPTSP